MKSFKYLSLLFLFFLNIFIYTKQKKKEYFLLNIYTNSLYKFIQKNNMCFKFKSVFAIEGLSYKNNKKTNFFFSCCCCYYLTIYVNLIKFYFNIISKLEFIQSKFILL